MDKMRAMLFRGKTLPLALEEIPIPKPSPYQVLIQVSACALCRTDLHIVDGELEASKLPLILGHQIVGTIVNLGSKVTTFSHGERVGVPWLGKSCSECPYCLKRQENLCDEATFTGLSINGGFAEYCVADSRFIFSLPSCFDDLHAAPLLCAGLIGYRALKMTEGAQKIGFFGYGSSAHLLTQIVNYQGGKVYAFIKPGGEMKPIDGVHWIGPSTTLAPEALDAAIIFAPVGALIPHALKNIKKGGVVVCAGIHMSEIPAFPYKLLWQERIVRSVANLTREDGLEFLKLAARIPIQTKVTTFSLEELPKAIYALKSGLIKGTAVIVP